MQCPACTKSPLSTTQTQGNPVTEDCPSCHGRWLAFDAHRVWLEALPPDRLENYTHATSQPVQPHAHANKPAKARTCPRCGKLMTRFRVGPDHQFTIERCPACAGVWFDAGEWEAVLSIVPLPRVQHIFNDSFQHKLELELRRRVQNERCRTILGDHDYQRAIAFKEWLAAHPKRDVLLALLDDRETPR